MFEMISPLRLFLDKFKEINPSKLKNELPNIIRSMITKSSEWERENEWRIVSFRIKNDEDRIAKLPIASKIITGINISDSDYARIKNIAQEKQIPIKRTRLNNEKYKLEIID